MRLSWIRSRASRLARDEGGFTMIAVLGAIVLVSALVGVAVAATNDDQQLLQRDIAQKRAYQAAQAGIADYTYHLNNDSGYWTRCANVPTPNAVNLQGSITKYRPVDSTLPTGPQYALELIPATGQTACSSASPTTTMIESTGPNIGTFRIRSTGYSGPAGAPGTEKQSIVASYKQATFLDYVYFTQLETSDPVTYGFANPSSSLTAAYDQCTKFRRDGRPRAGTVTPSALCDTIVFVAGDHIDGPMHTNDDICINPGDTPTFGRNAADIIEVSAPPTGYYSSSSTGNGCTGGTTKPGPGTFTTNAPVLTPPTTNTTLRTFAGPTYTYTGKTSITLSGNNMSINGGASVPFPTDGVVYVQNGAGCSTSYSPFTTTYPASSGCGNAVVHGNYSGQLTIAAENDIVVDNDITNAGGGLLGLVANNFVRVAHPFCATSNCGDGSTTAETGKGSCGTGVNGTSGNPGTPVTNNDVRIDAAILAIDHSFIVDHYDCGAKLGTLQVNGAIAQKFRGAVGTVGSTGHGYIKDYNYDDRLRYQEPPHFFDPVQSAWHVERETLG
jgi:Tfp pilus assembly protein PilX